MVIWISADPHCGPVAWSETEAEAVDAARELGGSVCRVVGPLDAVEALVGWGLPAPERDRFRAWLHARENAA